MKFAYRQSFSTSVVLTASYSNAGTAKCFVLLGDTIFNLSTVNSVTGEGDGAVIIEVSSSVSYDFTITSLEPGHYTTATVWGALLSLPVSFKTNSKRLLLSTTGAHAFGLAIWSNSMDFQLLKSKRYIYQLAKLTT